MNSEKINIAIVGFGNIGSYFYKTLEKNKRKIFTKTGKTPFVKYVSAKNINKKRKIKIPKSKWIKKPLNIPFMKDVDVLFELIGGAEGMAKKLVFSALKNKIHVITANKALMAKYGDQLAYLAEKNAKEALNRKLYETNNNKNLFEGINQKFNIKNNISLIEVYDNSHIQGTNSVGAMITFGEEGFVKKRYRKFDIKTKGAEKDDYAMLKEVLSRRFKRALLEKGNYLSLPDLLLIDGGKGQYSAAKFVLSEFGLHDLPMIAIAKGKFRNSGNETFFHNGKTFKFEKNDPTLFFLQRLRDESHRFAISAHRAKRKKSISKSLLDQIEGIGSIRKRALLNHFGSARSVESASFEEIKLVEGVEEKVAKKIYNFFHE